MTPTCQDCEIYVGVGIYKRKQESKKTRKQELDQESDQLETQVKFTKR